MADKSRELQKKFDNLMQEMRSKLIERDDEVMGMLVALLSRHHIFMVSPPGTAKSLAIKMLKDVIVNGENGAGKVRYFEILMMKSTLPDEVFGPYRISSLKRDVMERDIDGYLPTAHFAFLDEVWKANSAILNGLLKITNEREFKNGKDLVQVPLYTMFTASNELPGEDDLSAQYDRFMLRYHPEYIRSMGNFVKMCKTRDEDLVLKTRLTFDEINDAIAVVKAIEIPDDVIDMLAEIRENLKAEAIVVSDRRFRESLRCVRAFAFLNGRDIVSMDDLEILEHIFWSEPTDIQKVRKCILVKINPYQEEADRIYDDIMSAWNELEKADKSKPEYRMKASEVNGKVDKFYEELKKLRAKMTDEKKDVTTINNYIRQAEDILVEKIAKGIFKLKGIK